MAHFFYFKYLMFGDIYFGLLKIRVAETEKKCYCVHDVNACMQNTTNYVVFCIYKIK